MSNIIKFLIIVLLALPANYALSQKVKKAPTDKKKENTEKMKSIFDGYDKAAWGTSLEETRNNIAGKITYTDEKKVIISKDGNIKYNYGFFYKDPMLIKSDKIEEKKATTIPAEKKEAQRLFFVVIQFPFLTFDDVRKKMEDKYGKPTGESLKKNKGALIWESEKTTIVLWVDEYEKKPYCRKITYVSKEIAKEMNNYRTQVFNSEEIEVLKKLSP